MGKVNARLAKLEAAASARAVKHQTSAEVTHEQWVAYAAHDACVLIATYGPDKGGLMERLYAAITIAHASSDCLSSIRGNLRQRFDQAGHHAFYANGREDLMPNEAVLESLGFRAFCKLLPELHPELIGLDALDRYRHGVFCFGWNYRVEDDKLWCDGKEVVGPYVSAFGVEALKGGGHEVRHSELENAPHGFGG